MIFPVSLRLMLLLLGVGLGVNGAARAEPEFADGRPQKLLLAEGWWRGIVKLSTGPAEFLMQVRGTTVGDAEVIMYSEAATAHLSLLAQQDHERELVVYGNQAGEFLTGRLRNGAWFGRYQVNASGAAQTGGQEFSFWAQPKEPWEALPPERVWNLSGTWMLSLGPGETREVHLAHFNRRLRGYWREPGQGAVYLSGTLDGARFRLEGWRSDAVMEGEYENGGVLRGRFTDGRGAVSAFAMRRHTPPAEGERVASAP